MTTVGPAIAKNVFQVHGVDRHGTVVLRKRLARGRVRALFANLPPCLIGLEACDGAPDWARELSRLGHEVRLMPPRYIKAYVKATKHDAVDGAHRPDRWQQPRPPCQNVAKALAQREASMDGPADHERSRLMVDR